MSDETVLTSGDSPAQRLQEAIARAQRGLVQRGALVELIALAAVAEEHVLVIGPPGTGKSEAVRRIATALGGRYFEYLLGRFTEPSEIFGPVDLQRLRSGVVETVTDGMLPEADVAFIDEVFLGSTAILNTLLTLLNERVYRRGHTRIDAPLKVCVGASNALPLETQSGLAAFADRFLVRVFVEPVPDPLLEQLLEGGRQLDLADTRRRATSSAGAPDAAPLGHLESLTAAARAVDLKQLRPDLANAIRRVRSAGIHLSDRRVVRSQRLIAAATALAGRQVAETADLWPLIHCVPTREAQDLAREALADMLDDATSTPLRVAALEASVGPAARARSLVMRADELLRDGPPDVASDAADADADGPSGEAWRLRVEGIARDIDAGFAPEAMPAALAETRRRIVEFLKLNTP